MDSTTAWEAVNYEVTRTHERGRRLREGEQLDRVQGQLTIEPYQSKNKGGPVRLAATLWALDPPGRRRGLLQPLFDPTVIALDEVGVLRLSGKEINSDSDSGDIFDCAQVWVCTPIGGRNLRS